MEEYYEMLKELKNIDSDESEYEIDYDPEETEEEDYLPSDEEDEEDEELERESLLFDSEYFEEDETLNEIESLDKKSLKKDLEEVDKKFKTDLRRAKLQKDLQKEKNIMKEWKLEKLEVEYVYCLRIGDLISLTEKECELKYGWVGDQFYGGVDKDRLRQVFYNRIKQVFQ